MPKSFPGVRILDDIKFVAKPGNVHALISENGAGKSALMRYPLGLYHPDSRTIEAGGQVMDIKNPNDALRGGISMIRQELDPVPCRNVTNNIWTGRSQTEGVVVDESQTAEKTRNLLRDLDFDMDVTTPAENLSTSQVQATEIVKVVSYNAKIVIMDKPTSSLTVAETQHLFKIISGLRKEGRPIIYISHKLEEILETAGEVMVMGDSQYTGTWGIKDIIIDQLTGQMVGREMDERLPVYGGVRTDEVMLWIENSTSVDPRSFESVSFDLHRREILGIGRLVGAQRTGLIEAIFNLYRIIDGELTVNGKTVVNHSPQDAVRNGLAPLTEERRAMGITPTLSVWDSTLAVAYRKLTSNIPGYIYTKKLSLSVDKVYTDLGARMIGAKMLVRNLLGGNQQRMLIDRRLLTSCDVIVLNEPTRGMGADAKYEIYRIMQDLVKRGKAIIMVFSEMLESLGISDRIMIMCARKRTGVPGKKEAIQTEAMRYATQLDGRTKEGVLVWR